MASIRTDDDERALLWDFNVAADGSLASSATDTRWLHLRCDLPEVESILTDVGIPEPVREALSVDETRPRCAAMDGGTLLVVRGINLNPGAEPEDMVGLRIWFTDQLVITARRRSRQLLAVRDLRLALEAGRGPRNTAQLVANLVELLADRIGEFVDEIEIEIEELESGGKHGKPAAERRRRLTELRRDTAQIRRYLAPQRDALEMLLRLPSTLDDTVLAIIREQNDRTIRFLEDLELARERTVLAQDEVRSEVAEQQNARMYLLSLVTAVFLPLSFLTGVFGMNVAGLPGTEHPLGFLGVLAIMGVIAVVVFALLKSRNWF
ncbi:MAG: CorA family divalent cation transporter [Pseudomonadota bacterium]